MKQTDAIVDTVNDHVNALLTLKKMVNFYEQGIDHSNPIHQEVYENNALPKDLVVELSGSVSEAIANLLTIKAKIEVELERQRVSKAGRQMVKDIINANNHLKWGDEVYKRFDQILYGALTEDLFVGLVDSRTGAIIITQDYTTPFLNHMSNNEPKGVRLHVLLNEEDVKKYAYDLLRSND